MTKILCFLYRLLDRTFLGKHYLYSIKRIYETIRPSDEQDIYINTMKIFLKSIIISILVIVISLKTKGNNIYNYLIVISMVVIFNHQLIERILAKEEFKLLCQLEEFLEDVRHYYYYSKTVEEAVFDSLWEAEYEISLHMNIIYEILLNENSSKAAIYKELSPNKYLLTFLAICQITIQYGDCIKDGKSLFVSNINELKNELKIEILKRERLKYIFSGLIFITLIPIFFLKAIENWGIHNLPELKQYYGGKYGIIALVVVFIITCVSYYIICKMKESYRYEKKEHYILEELCKRKYISRHINRWIIKNRKRAEKLDILIKSTDENLTIKQWRLKQEICYFISFIIILGIALNLIFIDNGRINIYDICVSVAIAAVGSVITAIIPTILLRLKEYFLKSNIEEEVMQFQSIIIMLKNIPKMNVEIVMEWLEDFSLVFRHSIMECVDNFSYDDMKALKKLKESEENLQFKRLVENLEICDKVGIEKAFEEIESQREYYLEKRKQDNEISISNRGVMAKVLAYIPLIFTIIFYLILPFIYESVMQLMEYVNQFKELY